MDWLTIAALTDLGVIAYDSGVPVSSRQLPEGWSYVLPTDLDVSSDGHGYFIPEFTANFSWGSLTVPVGAAYVAENQATHSLAIVFRGTANWPDKIADLTIPTNNLDYVLGLFSPLISAAKAYAQTHGYTLYTAGHSLGGALAELLYATDSDLDGGVSFAGPGPLVTGGPGNDPNFVHITHDYDLIGNLFNNLLSYIPGAPTIAGNGHEGIDVFIHDDGLPSSEQTEIGGDHVHSKTVYDEHINAIADSGVFQATSPSDGMLIRFLRSDTTNTLASTAAFNGYTNIIGGDLADVINGSGTGTSLRLEGGGGDDSVSGGSNADRLAGGEDSDSIVGGAGNDSIYGFTGGDIVDGGADTDSIILNGSSSALSSASDAQIANIENITAIDAESGILVDLHNQSEGFAITGSSHPDQIFASAGNDTIVGFTGADQVDGGAGTDAISLAATSSALNNAADVQIVGIEAVLVSGSSATTIDLHSQSEGFTITGGDASDAITGGAGPDSINGGAGNDTITDFIGNDTVDGGVGTADAIALLATSTDFNSASDAQISNVEAITAASATQGVAIDLHNQQEGFSITGSANDDTITGTSGTDSISAGNGDDLIVGFTSTDTVNGGAGTDTIQLSSTADLNAASDTRLVGVENIALTQASTLTLSAQTEVFRIVGSSQADIITAGSGNDTIEGKGGADTLTGGAGSDWFTFSMGEPGAGQTLDGGTGTDALNVAAGNSADFRPMGQVFTSIEKLSLQAGATGIFDHRQLNGATGGLPTTLVLAGIVGSTETVDIRIAAAGSIDLSNWTFSNWTNGTDIIVITGSSGADTIKGSDDNDIFSGFAGADSLTGGTGTDTIALAATSADLNSALDTQLVTVEAVDASGASSGVTIDLVNQTEAFSITGSANADVLKGGAGADSFLLSSTNVNANDTFDGRGGSDALAVEAGQSADLRTVGNGFTSIEKLTMGAGSTATFDYTQFSSPGTSGFLPNTLAIVGTAGSAETIYFEMLTAGTFSLASMTFTSWTSGTDIFQIDGSNGADSITGSSQADRIFANAGDDTIVGFAGADQVDGGAGSDLISLSGTASTLNSATDAQIANVESISVSVTSAVAIDLDNQSEGFTITGNNGADQITGGAGADSISGGSGNDTITNFIGNDTIDGGTGTADTIALLATSAALTSADNAQIANVETVTAASAAQGVAIDLHNQSEGFGITGSAHDDTITGTSNADNINAGSGDDLIIGFSGTDTVNGGLGVNTLQLSGSSANLDVALDSQLVNIDKIALTGAATLTLSAQTDDFYVTATPGADIITGGSGDDTLEGKGGVDTLDGGAGADWFTFSSGEASAGQTINGGTGTDALNVAAGNSVDFRPIGQAFTAVEKLSLQAGSAATLNYTQLNGAAGALPTNLAIVAVANSVKTIDVQMPSAGTISLAAWTFSGWTNGTDAIRVTGSSGPDTITGSSNNDWIVGFVGADSLVGGAGIDTIVLSATSSDLNAASDAQIVTIETVDASLAPAGVSVDLHNQSEAFTLIGSNFVDTLKGGSGADSFVVTNANVNAGDTFDGGPGTDILSIAAGRSADFRPVGAGFTSVEGLTLNAGASATFDHSQLVGGANRLPANLAVTAISGSTETIDVEIATPGIINLSAWTFTTWTTGTDVLQINGSNGADTITASSQADDIAAGAGDDIINGFVSSDAIDGGEGYDTIVLMATASALNSASNASLINVEAISAAGAAAGVTISLGAQSEGLRITGSSSGDVITGSAGDDTIFGYVGTDTITGGTGMDVIVLSATSADLNTATDDRIGSIEAIDASSATAGVVIDLHLQSNGFDITGSNFADTLKGSTAADSFIVTSANANAGDVLDGGGGSDTLTVVAGDTVDFRPLGNAFTSIEKLSFQAGAHAIFYGSQVDGSMGALPATLGVVGAGGSEEIDIYLSSTGGFNLSSWTFTSWTSGTDVIKVFGSSGADIITLSSQADQIYAGAGNDQFYAFGSGDVVDGGEGIGDEIFLSATSSALNGASDENITNVEAIAAVAGAGALTIDLHNQSEGFSIFGGASGDTITGGAGADTIFANGGSDTIVGFAGADSIDGGVAGTDTIKLTATSPSLNAASDGQVVGIEAVSASSAVGDVEIDLHNQSEGFVVTGSSHDDTITGSTGADIINPGAGDDLIKEFSGADDIDGGSGNDTLLLSATAIDLNNADDANLGGVENVSAAFASSSVAIDLSHQSNGFLIEGSIFDDTIIGSSGNDTFHGGSGADIMHGGAGADTFLFYAGEPIYGDVFDGGSGTDILKAAANNSVDFRPLATAFTSIEEVKLDSDATVIFDASQLSGAAGALPLNLIMAGAAADTGEGVTVYMAAPGTFDASGWSFSNWTGGTEFVRINGSSGNDNIEGSLEADTIEGGDGNDTLEGHGGSDKISGGAGNDSIIRIVGDDTIDGGTGVDTLYVASNITASTFTDDELTNVEIIDASDNYEFQTVGATVNLSAQTEGFIIYTDVGRGEEDTVKGGAGDDALMSFTHFDFFDGGAGHDTIYLLSGSAFGLNVAANSDIVNVETIDFSLNFSSVSLSLSGQTDGFEIIGGIFSDTITGSSGGDTIDAGFGGGDSVNGGNGDDRITYDFFDVAIAGGNGTDTLAISRAVTLDLTAADQTAGDAVNVTGFENADASASSAGVDLKGSSAANTLTGGSGNDTFNGFIGADVINGGAGSDKIVLIATSADLNGAIDGQIGNVESIDASGAAGISLDLHNQTEGFELTGGAFADTMTGSTGNDTINITNGDFDAGESIAGGAGIDTIVLTSPNAVIDFSVGSLGGIENLVSDGNDTVTLTVAQFAGLSAVDLGPGADTLNVLVNGTVDITAGNAPLLSGIEHVNLIGTGVANSLFLSRAQFAEFTSIANTLITKVNVIPVAVADSNAGEPVIEAGTHPAGIKFEGDPSATGNVLANDTDRDVDDTKTVIGVATGVQTGLISGGVGALFAGTYGTLKISADGSWNYTLDNDDPDTNGLAQGVTGMDVFSYSMADGYGGTSTATLSVSILGTNELPEITSGPAIAGLFKDTTIIGSTFALAQSGTMAFNDADIGDTHSISSSLDSATWSGGDIPSDVITALEGALSGTILQDATSTGHGTLRWHFSRPAAVFDFLSDTETLTANYKFAVTDSDGSRSEQIVSINVVGTAASGAGQSAVAQENADQTGNSDAHQLSGSIDSDGAVVTNASISGQTLTYLDADGHSQTLSAGNNAALRAFDINVPGPGPATSVDWSYAIADNVLDFLSSGETVTIDNTIATQLQGGDVESSKVTIIVEGTNDLPVFESAAVSLSFVETANTTGSLAPLTGAGSSAFHDVDLNDTDIASSTLDSAVWSGGAGAPLDAALLGAALQVSAIHDGSTGEGAVNWSFSVPEQAVDFLGAGETLALQYEAGVTDASGETVSQPFTVTITGTNDGPQINAQASDLEATVVKSPDGAPYALHQETGTLYFGDADIAETHNISFQPQGDGYLGTFIPVLQHDSDHGGQGAVGWSFAVDDSALAELTAFAERDQVYDVTVTDEHGASSTQSITVALKGAGAQAHGGDLVFSLSTGLFGSGDPDIHVDFDDLYTTISGSPTYHKEISVGGSINASLQATLGNDYRIGFGPKGDLVLHTGSVNVDYGIAPNEVLSTTGQAINQNPFIDLGQWSRSNSNLSTAGIDLLNSSLDLDLAGELYDRIYGTLNARAGVDISFGSAFGYDLGGIHQHVSFSGTFDRVLADYSFNLPLLHLHGEDISADIDLAFGNLKVQLPPAIVASTSRVSGSGLGSLTAGGESAPFITVSLDLDKIIEYFFPPAAPFLHGAFEFSPFPGGVLAMDYTTLDAILRGSGSFVQKTSFTPTSAHVTMTSEFGQTVSGAMGDKFAFDTPEGEGDFAVSAEYDLGGDVSTKFGTRLSAAFDYTILQAELDAALSVSVLGYHPHIEKSFDYTFAQGTLPIGGGFTIPLMELTNHYDFDPQTKTYTLHYEKFYAGTDGNDTFTLTTHQVTASGNDGADSIDGNALANTIDGGSGDDSIVTGDGDDLLIGGSGADTLIGGDGNNTASYATESEGTKADLVEPGSNQGDAFGDVLQDIENLIGGDFADTLAGDEQGNALAGGAGDDILIGREGADTVDGGDGSDTASYATANSSVVADLANSDSNEGDAGGDVYVSVENLVGSTYNDSLAGDAVDNILDGAYGDDTLSGADGDDTLLGGPGADQLYGGTGNNTASYVTALAGVTANLVNPGLNQGDAFGDSYDGIENIWGSAFADVLQGDDIGNILIGNDGSDVVSGAAGNDSIAGDDGADTLDAGTGENTVDGGAGADSIQAGNGDDVVTGGAGADTIDAGGGDNSIDSGSDGDAVTAGNENDTLSGGEGADTLDAGNGNNLASGGDGNDVVTAGGGNDSLAGESGSDTLHAGDGNDTLNGGAGGDIALGGPGNDLYHVDDAGDAVVEMANFGNDTVESDIAIYTLPDNVEELIFTGVASSASSGFDGRGNSLDNRITGSDTINNGGIYGGNDTLEGFGGNDTLKGLSGNDSLSDSGSGNDCLDGGFGVDTMAGGAGNDTYAVDNLADVVREDPNAGVDKIITTLHIYSLAAQVEMVDFAGTDTFSGTGNGLNNVITAGAGDDLLNGLAGDDTLNGGGGKDLIDGGTGGDAMLGGSGDDTYSVDNASDLVTENANEGHDVVNAGITAYTLTANVEDLVFTGIGAFSGAGNAIANAISGGTGNDTLSGFADSDTLIGLSGNDSLDGGAGIDSMWGGAGDDVYNVDSSNDLVFENGGEGTDTVNASAGSYTLAADVEVLTFVGSGGFAGNGNVLANAITGGAGGNTIVGLGGNDTITGGASADFLDGDIGNDSLNAGGGDDQLLGGSGADTEAGGGGNDFLDGGTGDDSLLGGAGDDTYVLNSSTDKLVENPGEGSDLVETTLASFSLASSTMLSNVENLAYIGAGDFSGTGNSDANRISGFDGNDMLNGGAGNDTLIGGIGDDRYTVDAGDIVIEQSGGGIDEVSAGTSLILFANVENLTLTGTAALNGTGNELGNVITGNTGANNLLGLGGDDTLSGATGADSMAGGLGDDSYVVDNAGDLVIENANEGIDTVTSPLAFVLPSNVEILFLSGSAAVAGTGNGLDNAITGNSGANSLAGLSGNDTLIGGAGADTLAGGLGDDVYGVDNAGDKIIEAAGEGADAVQASVTYTLASNIENLFLTGTSAINGTGNTIANVVSGNSGNNTLAGLSGADTLDGGSGIDTATYAASAAGVNINLATGTVSGGDADGDLLVSIEGIIGSNQNDTIEGDFRDNVLNGGNGVDLLSYEHAGAAVTVNLTTTTAQATGGAGTDTISVFENLTGSDFNDSLTGSTANNILSGLGGNDTLSGSTGADTMLGGTGDDLYVVDNSADAVTENSGEGADTVQTSASYTLGANIENLTLTGTSVIAGTGNSLANIILGNSGANTLTGLDGDDSLSAGSGNDSLVGGNGNDSLDGGAGLDSMVGGLNDDTYVVDSATDVITEAIGEGIDTVQAAIAYTLSANIEILILTGTSAINGTGNADTNTIIGNGANNILEGRGGADILDGGAGSNTATYISSTLGVNVSFATGLASGGDAQGDVLLNIQNLTGSNQNDTLEGDGGDNVLNGGNGVDTLSYEHAAAGVTVNLATTTIQTTGGAGKDTISVFENLIGSTFADVLTGGTDANMLYGLAGNDTLSGGNNADTMLGGADDDLYVVDNSADAVTENFGEGIDTIQTSVSYTLAANVENLTLTGTGAIAGTGNALANVILGNSGANTLTGLDGDDSLSAGSGNDSLIGGNGNDTLDGGGDSDFMAGGLNDDTYVVDSATDLITEAIGEGIDTVQAAIAYTLSANIEILILTGTSAINGTGNADANSIIGNGANNILEGRGGADILDGGAGSNTATYISSTLGVNVSFATGLASGGDAQGDVLLNIQNLTGSNQNDTLEGDGGDNVLNGGNGVDTLSYEHAAAGVTVNLATTTIQTTGGAGKDTISVFESLIGSTFADVLTGGTDANMLYGLAGNDTISGGTNADTMLGGAGDDLYVVDNSADAVTENFGEGIDTIQTSVSYTLAANVENLTLTGTGAIAGTGNALANVILGNSGANTLTGLDGDDSLSASSGNDSLIGGNGNDTIDGGAGSDSMVGGLNDDTYVVDSATDVITEASGEGIDTVQASIAYTLSANIENLILTGASAINGTGNADANSILGNGANNVLEGRGGADTLDGGAGTNTATYISSTLSVNVSLATGLGSAGDAQGDVLLNIQNLTGSGQNDTLEGDGGNNVLNGGNGVDTLSYEHAAAGVTVNLATTTAQATGGAGTDTISVFENLTGSNFNDVLTGSTLSNILMGLGGNDTLSGGTGADAMLGGTGSDVYVVDNAADVVTENSGEGVDTVQASVSYTLAANVENLTLTGTAIAGTGNALANVILGNSSANTLTGLDGDDTLSGDAGNDTLDGGAGMDRLTGGAGADKFIFTPNDNPSPGAAIGEITDFSHSQTDKIDVSQIDAIAGGLDNAFSFIGSAVFGGTAGLLHYIVQSGKIVVEADTNGDGLADFGIVVDGVTSITAADFIL